MKLPRGCRERATHRPPNAASLRRIAGILDLLQAPPGPARSSEAMLAELEQRRVDATCTRQLPLRSQTTE